MCSCCGLMVKNEPLPYCTSLGDIGMGVGVHLFFRNYLFNSLVFLLMFLIFSIYAIATNVKAFDEYSSEQAQKQCIIDDANVGKCGFSRIGAGSKVLVPNDANNKMSQIQSWLGIAFVILWGLLMALKTHLEEKFFIDMEMKRVSASDFTLLITNFPKIYLNKSYEENLNEIQELFREYGKRVNSIFSYEVVKINIARPLYSDKKANQEKK